MNTNQLNSAMLNDAPIISVPIASDYDAIEFNGLSLQSAEIISTMIMADSMPSREVSTFKIPRDNGAKIVADYFRERKVMVEGIIKQASASALDTFLDSFKRQVVVKEGVLSYKLNGNVRQVKATLANSEQMFNDRQGYHVSYCPFKLEFSALEPFWHAIGYDFLLDSGITSLSFSNSIENLGTYKANAVFIFVVDSATSVTGVNIKNTTNGDEINITANLNANDVLVIDGEEKSVTLNGIEIDYDGIFPKLEYGTNNYTYTIAGTDINYSATIKFKKTYL